MKDTKNSGLKIKNLKEKHRKIIWRKTTVVSLVVVFMGLVLPEITLLGAFSPLAVGLAASVSGVATIPVFLASFIGYLLRDFTLSLRYISALIAVIGLRWSVSGFPKIASSRYFAPTIAFLASLITGSTLSLSPPKTVQDIALLVVESVLAAGFSIVCTLFFKENGGGETREIQFGTITVISVLLMPLFALEWQGISLGKIAVFLLLFSSIKSGGFRGGILVGSITGMMIFLCDTSLVYLLPVCAVGGMLAGIFSEKNRLLSSLIFIAIDVIARLSVDASATSVLVIDVYEIILSLLISYLMPNSFLSFIGNLTREKGKRGDRSNYNESAALKMRKAANTMSQVAGVVDSVSRELATVAAPNMGSMYRSMADRCCCSCKNRVDCWEKSFSDTMDSFNHMTRELKEKGTISAENVLGHLKQTCIKLEEICREVSEAYQEFLVRESAFNRLYELNGIVNDQFENTARILREFSYHCETTVQEDSATALLVEKELKKEYPSLEKVRCYLDGRGHMKVEILLNKHCDEEEITRILRCAEKVCKRKFSSPIAEHDDEKIHIALSEGEVYYASVGAAQSKCKGEKLCGDAFEVFRDISGNQYVVLSDGMGTGGRAAVDGAMAAGLTSELLKAGFGHESTLSIVNTALMTKSKDESLATLDIACINLFTGELKLLKAGAGVSLLLSRERVSYFSESSLPLGILRELTFAYTQDRLVEGDILLLMSDGISNNDVSWVEELLQNFNPREESVQLLSQRIIDTAKSINDEEDDMTVIAIRLEKTIREE